MEINDIDFIKTTTSKLGGVVSDYPSSFIHVHDSNGDDQLYIGESRVTDNFNIGDMDVNTKTNKVGGLESTTLGSLKDKSMSQIIMNMICPLIKPTHNNPSISLSYSGSTLIKVGTNLPVKENITIKTDGGKWSDGTTYAGSCGDVTLVMSPDKWGEVSEEKSYNISGSGTFSEGGIPKDNHGNSYPEMKYKGGNVSSNTITITAVQPIYINDNNITEMSERIINYNSVQTLYVTIQPEVDGTLDKFKVYLPSNFSTFEVKQYNPVSGKYDVNVNMELMAGETSKYIRTNDVNNTNTGVAKYEIKIKK